MKHTLRFLITIIFCSCGQKSEQTKTKENVSATRDNLVPYANEMEKNNDEWEKHKDSLRNEILKSKENKILKESFLQEMYIRNVVSVSKDSLFVTIPFDLHSADCGAPDGYSTDISFSFKLGDTLIFPKRLQFQEHEHGSIPVENGSIKFSGVFQLVEQTDSNVIYHSIKDSTILILDKMDAAYYTGIKQNRIDKKNVLKILRDWYEDADEVDKENGEPVPYRSTVLLTNEYERFLH